MAVPKAPEGVPGLAFGPETRPPPGCGNLACEQVTDARRELEALQDAKAELLEAATAGRRLLEEQRREVRRMELLGREADHRLLNGVQLVASLLAMQARKASNPEAAAELQIASRRVATIGNLHRRLHGADGVAVVELTEYLENVCREIVEMLALEGRPGSISFSGASLHTPRTVAIPLGFICAELLTNAAKHAEGDIAVRLEPADGGRYVLSVTDQGPGLPAGFDPSAGRGLGMKIIVSLVKDVAGELVVDPGGDGRGARFAVLFSVAA